MKKNLFLTLSFLLILFTNCSTDDDSPDSPNTLTVSEQIQGRWLRVGEVIDNQEQYYEDPCVNYDFFAEGRLQIRWCNSTTTNGNYTVLDDEHVELEDYNDFGDDSVATILNLNEDQLILNWALEFGSGEVTYIFERVRD